jgi:ABC-type nitrate/sulfonate/bicarbonate transport system substrate-binding protein
MSSQRIDAGTEGPSPDLRIGFVPLADCATLAIAHEKGFFARHGLRVELRKVQSWAQIHDRLQAGEIDMAHMLVTMPLMHALEGNGRGKALCSAFTLSRHGNGILLSNAIWNAGVRDPRGLAAWMAADPRRLLRLGVVYPRSTHEYFLRSWLDAGGLKAGQRILLRVIPPQEMVGRLRKGEIDGFCVGEPWSRRAADSKLGRVVAESGTFLNGVGEKVLGTTLAWHKAHPREHALVIRALVEASAWLEVRSNRMEALDLLASKKYVNTARSAMEATLLGAGTPGGEPGHPSGIQFYRDGANFPSRGHARWYLEQALRWGHAAPDAAARVDLDAIFLEEYYRSVLWKGLDPDREAAAAAGGDGVTPRGGTSCQEILGRP